MRRSEYKTVLKSKDYQFQNLLKVGLYNTLVQYAIFKTEPVISLLIKSFTILEEIQKSFIPQDFNPPRLYGFPKIPNLMLLRGPQ